MDVDIRHPFLEFQPNTVLNIRKLYNLDEGRIVQSVDILEDWVKKQDHFLNKNFSRRYLESSIIICKGSIEKAKKQIDRLCTYKTLLPKFFVSSGMKILCDHLNGLAHVVVLPKMTKDYERAFILKINSKDFTSSDYLKYYKLIFAMAEYLKAHDYVNGFTIIYDLRDVNLVDFMTKLNLTEMQQFIAILIEGFGARLRGIHVITESKIVDVFIKTLKAALTQKMADRIHVHPKFEDLYQEIDKEILPIEFGGTERSVKELQAEWTKLLSSEEHEKYLEVMKASGTDESLRQTDKFNEQYMGMPGSFRTLTVD